MVAGSAGTAAQDTGTLPPGSFVKGLYLEDDWYCAEVKQHLGNETYEIDWLDGDTEDRLKSLHELKLMQWNLEHMCYVEVPMPASVSGLAAEREEHCDSDSDANAKEGTGGGTLEGVHQMTSGAQGVTQQQGGGQGHGQGQEQAQEKDSMEQMVVTLETRRHVEPEGAEALVDPVGMLRGSCHTTQDWQEELRGRIAKQMAQVIAPLPEVSVAELGISYEDCFHRAAPRPKVRRPSPVREVGDLWLVVSIPVERRKSLKAYLSPGSLVSSLRCEEERLHFKLLAGWGPASGSVSTKHVQKVLHQAELELERDPQRNRRAWPPVKTHRLTGSVACLLCRRRIPPGGSVSASVDGCALPVHEGCMDQQLRKAERALCTQLAEQLEEAEAGEEEELRKAARIKDEILQEGALKHLARCLHNIGWREDMVPSNHSHAHRLGLTLPPNRHCCLKVDEDLRVVRVAKTMYPDAAVNLEYLSIVLKMYRETSALPWFSLDPVDPSSPTTELHKNFEPKCLAGTSVGELLFQADYHLKDLSMGQFLQPLPGMVSCWDLAEGSTAGPDWDARIWIRFLEAGEYCLSEDDVLIPLVKLEVTARELVTDSSQDASSTRADHPLVRYAETFPFEAVAQRVSVFRHMKELAKAVALAKFLVDYDYDLGGSWLDLAPPASECKPTVPRLWQRRPKAASGAMAFTARDGSTNIIYGGVDLSMDGFDLQRPRRIPTRRSDADATSSNSEEQRRALRAQLDLGDRPLPKLFIY